VLPQPRRSHAEHPLQAGDGRCRGGSGRRRRIDRQRRDERLDVLAGGLVAPPAAQHGPFDPSKGGHTSNGRTETLLTGDVAASVRKAALAKVSGTVERVETNVDDSAPYEAHIRKADGTEVTVEVDKDLSVASVQTMGAHP
jgi:hypothetical protein